MNSRALLFITLLCSINLFSQGRKTYNIQTIAFYNLENLFDAENDPITFDDVRTEEVYLQKLENMALAISKIGADVAKNSPVVIGVSEIENRKVLEDLVNQPSLSTKNYGIAHFDSPDRRGIDVALLYQKSIFKPKNIQNYELVLYDNNSNKRIYTRDQLVTSGYLDGDLIHIIVNHWPSRRGGEERSTYKRKKAAELNKKIMDSLFAIDPYSKVITMGDFNDNPNDRSIKKILDAKSDKENIALKGLYNPMLKMTKKGIGTHAWRDSWGIFDQIIISNEFLTKDYTSYRYYKAGIFNKDFLTTQKGKYKGYPFRSFSNGSFTDGYSDHYPVYIYVIKQEK